MIKNDQTGADTSKAKQFLLNEMSDLEQMKAMMPEGTTKEDHKNNVENFVMSVFTATDKEERTCETITKKHAMDFNRCSHFIMLLSIWEDIFDA